MVINFAAEPAKLPDEVLKEVQQNLLNCNGSGISVMEMSHRSPTYDKIQKDAMKTLREPLDLPDNYKVILMQGGGTGQFAAWIKQNGGVEGMCKKSEVKSKLIYDIIDKSNEFYYCPLEKNVRSGMNVPFRIGSPQGGEKIEQSFLLKAESEGMIQLKGHRSVGVIRASLYNAVTVEETQKLANLMKEFYKNNQK